MNGEQQQFVYYADPTYVDDLALMLRRKRPKALIGILIKTVSITFRIFNAHGLRLNWKPGKTEAVLQLRGPQTRDILTEIHWRDGGWIECEPGVKLHITATYTHLGGRIQGNGDLVPEIRARAFQGAAEWKPLARAVTRDLNVPPERHMQIAAIYILSKVLYLAGSWGPVAPRKSIPLQRLWVDIVRECYGARRVAGRQEETDVEVLARAEAPTLRALLRTARLSYFAQLAGEAPPMLIALLQNLAALGDGWVAAILDDLYIMKLQLPQCAEMPWPKDDPAAWIELAREWPTSFKALAKKLTWDSAAVDLAIGVAPPSQRPRRDPLAVAPEGTYNYKCNVCGSEHETFQGLQTHRTKKHGFVHMSQQFAYSSICCACLRDYHQRFRLVRHLREGHACLEWLAQRAEPLQEETRAALQAEDSKLIRGARVQGLLRPAAVCKPVRVPGPLPPDLPKCVSGRRDRPRPR